MNPHYTYLLVNFFCIVIPFIFSFHPRIKFNREFSGAVPAILSASVAFVLWDAAFTAMGVWRFNERYVTGIYVLGLPLEEILFFFCIPFACLFTYYCLKNVFEVKNRSNIATAISITLCIALPAAGIFYADKLYSSGTFFLLAILILFLLYLRVNFLFPFYLMYGIILLPFFLSNGLLTGLFTDEPVVIYNDEQNTGIRFFTIPVEDFFYGMLLLLLNVALFEFFSGHPFKRKRGTN